MENPKLPNTKDILGEHLFPKVAEVHPDQAEYITGILLGAPNEDILAMLEDKSFLEGRIEGVIRVIMQTTDSETKDSEKFGDVLYEKVLAISPEYAAKITGMLLELDANAITHLLDSNSDLQIAVHKAVKVLEIQQDRSEKKDQVQSLQTKVEIGEAIFSFVDKKYSTLAPQITGMLLEMDEKSLKSLLQHPSILEEKVQEAVKVLTNKLHDDR